MSTANEVRVLPEVTMTDELAKAIQDAVTAADVKSLLLAAAEKEVATAAQLAADQKAAEDAAVAKAKEDAEAQAATTQSFKRVENIGGVDMEFDGSSEAEVDRLVLNAYKVAYNVRQPEREIVTVVDPAAQAAAEAAAAEQAATDKAELERRFRLNEISAAEYIQQSGAMKQYLENEGISIDALKETVNANQGKIIEQSWAQAGEAFRNSPAGADWPGGTRNQELIGMKIAALGLEDAEDKVAALARAYQELKSAGTLFPLTVEEQIAAGIRVPQPAVVPDPAAVAARAATEAAAEHAAATRAAAAAKVQSMSSSIFGASSGTSGAPVISPAVVEAKKIIPPDATPAEILQAWKEEQIKAGISPDVAFKEQYSANRR
jgi:hypothetical protein